MTSRKLSMKQFAKRHSEMETRLKPTEEMTTAVSVGSGDVASQSETADNDDTSLHTGRTRNSAISSKLLSRAQTLLRGATMHRENHDGDAKTHGVKSRPSNDDFQLKPVITTLHREKTVLEVVAKQQPSVELARDDDEEMELLMAEIKRKELTDSDFDTDLEDDETREFYFMCCRHSSLCFCSRRIL